MNKKLTVLLAAGLLTASCLGVSAEEPVRTVTVTGNAKVTVPADMATFYVSVESKGKDASEASSANAAVMNKVRNAVILAGADSSKLETSSYSVSPEYTYEKGKSKMVGYRAYNTMKVVVDNVKITGKIMDAATDAGATNVGAVNFGLKNESAYKDKALRIAAQDAFHKANVLANAVGRQVIGTVSLSESNVYVQPVYRSGMKLMAAQDNTRTATELEPADQDIESTVSAVFQIN
jgi:uncharacterized protein YggE